jgi:hypothetical protein
MISQSNLPQYIEQEIPELKGISKPGIPAGVYNVVRQLTTHTAAQVAKHNLKAARHCLSVAEQIYKKANAAIKNAIENVFVFSFSHAFFSDDTKRSEILKIVPASLYDLYKSQVVNSHL